MSPRPQPGREFVLTVSCDDRPGLVFAVSSYFVQHRGNILSSQQFDDRQTGLFFMRVVVEIARKALENFQSKPEAKAEPSTTVKRAKTAPTLHQS